jgi:hypothetical protein
LRSGASLALLRKLPPEAFVRNFDQVLGLLLVNLLLWIGLKWWQHPDADTVLGPDVIYGLGSSLLLTLLGCALVARMNSREADTRGLLIPLLSVAPFVQVVFQLGSALLQGQGRSVALTLVALGVGSIYLGALALRVLQAAYGRVRLGAGLTAILLILATPVLLDALDLDTQLWLANDTSDASSDDDTAEPLLYAQPERLAAAVGRVSTQHRDGGDVYFVGFAGDGDQGVFRREALLAGRAVETHFGTSGRSVVLINDVDDRDTYPLATVTGLSWALKLLAHRIDLANDVVVLALTSHGSSDGLAVDNGALPLLQLQPNDLRQGLDEAGIKWRVVIVSACYAGVFVDALKSDTSLVITAADASNTSFGCDDKHELTYFGQAFFKEALPGSGSLEQAFQRAATLISQRESAQGLDHSNPQMYMGALMRAKLAGIETRSRPGSRALVVNVGGRTCSGPQVGAACTAKP